MLWLATTLKFKVEGMQNETDEIKIEHVVSSIPSVLSCKAVVSEGLLKVKINTVPDMVGRITVALRDNGFKAEQIE